MEMITRLKEPFLAFTFMLGLVLWSAASWVGVGIIQQWPGFRGAYSGGGIVMAVTLAFIGLMLFVVTFRPGWKS